LIEVDIIEDDFNTRVAVSLDSIKTKYGIRGLAYTVILSSKSIKSGLHGIQSPGVDLTKNDLWYFASSTKMVTAVLIMQLVDEGAISVEDKLSKFAFRHPNIDTNYTIRQLLGHNTNFANYTRTGHSIWSEIYGNRSKVFELDYLLDKYIPPPSSNPPTGWEYSNTNYAILGLIVEELTGKDYATVAKEKVFDPLGLKNTSIKTEGMDVKDLNGLWRYFGIELEDLNDVSVNSFLSMWGGAGALVSTTD